MFEGAGIDPFTVHDFGFKSAKVRARLDPLLRVSPAAQTFEISGFGPKALTAPTASIPLKTVDVTD